MYNEINYYYNLSVLDKKKKKSQTSQTGLSKFPKKNLIKFVDISTRQILYFFNYHNIIIQKHHNQSILNRGMFMRFNNL